MKNFDTVLSGLYQTSLRIVTILKRASSFNRDLRVGQAASDFTKEAYVVNHLIRVGR